MHLLTISKLITQNDMGKHEATNDNFVKGGQALINPSMNYVCEKPGCKSKWKWKMSAKFKRFPYISYWYFSNGIAAKDFKKFSRNKKQ